MARDLLIEIGTEELPSSFVTHALEAIPGIARELLSAQRLDHGALETLGTARRLALRVRDLEDRQQDLSELVTGPPKSVAFGDDGKPTKAGEGFARKQGADASALQVVETDKGEYVAVRREEPGRPAAEVLPELLATLCRRIPFPKSMRWADLDVAFGRPVHWLVALHGEQVVPFEFAGVTADRRTRGHRFLAPDEVELASADAYVQRLREAHVVVDVEERRRLMREGLERAAAELGGRLVEDDFLIEECVSLVEEPHVVPGRFDEEFLELPDAVVVSVMRDHQRYFAVREAEGESLLPRYLNVVNTANDPDTIARGNDRVLRARLADARFFVEEDRKRSLESRVQELDRVVFQKKLGTVGDKVRRVGALAAQLATEVGERDGVTVDAARAEHAARLCKADLVTLIVGEFPELQGDMGRWYALRQDVDAEVADAIRDHYRPRGAGDAVPEQALGAVVAVADRIDTLVGCFGVGLTPSGSADPFALRRAALGVVRIALEGPIDVRVARVVGASLATFGEQDKQLADDVRDQLADFFRARLRSFYVERFPTDLVEACLSAWVASGLGSIRDLDARIRALASFRKRPEYDSLAVAFKRTFNIAGDAPDGAWEPGEGVEPAEKSLAERFEQVRPSIEHAVGDGDYEQALGTVAEELRQPIDRFFDEVFVMVDDERLRDNRLRLLGRIADTLEGIAHFQLLST